MHNIYAAHPAKVLKIKQHTSQEWSFVIRENISGLPGQFVMVSLPNAGEIPVSVSGYASDAIEVTIRNVGKVTSQLFRRVKVGGQIYIRGPYGNGFPLEKFEGYPLLIITGGTGISPVKPLIEYYLKQGSPKLRKLDVLAGFRTPRHILFREEIEDWKKKCRKNKQYNIDIEVTVDTDEDYAWLGSIGFVVNFVKTVSKIGEDTRAIVIGAPLMMRNSVKELLLRQVKEANIWLSFERHMKCGVGKCGHCRIREKHVCTDGPVFNYRESKEFLVL